LRIFAGVTKIYRLDAVDDLVNGIRLVVNGGQRQIKVKDFAFRLAFPVEINTSDYDRFRAVEHSS
jgi:hypothetical protein